MGEETQGPRRGDARIELAQRAGGGIARVDVSRLAIGLEAGIHLRERGFFHVHFAAYFEHGGRALQRMGNVRNRAQIGGDILSLAPIAAGCALHEAAVLIAQRRGEAVDFRLGGERWRGAEIEETLHAGDESVRVFRIESVVERKHRHGVAHLAEFLHRRGANAQRRAILANEIWKARLDGGIALAQRVVFRVGQDRRVLGIIELVVASDLGGEALKLRGGLLWR